MRLHQQIGADPYTQEVFAALEGVSRKLANLPPLSIPGDVIARVDAALTREVRTWSQTIPTNRSAPEPARRRGSIGR